MQLGKPVVRHHREHVVLDVVVHVPVQEPVDPAHLHRAGVQPVVEHVLAEPGVLGEAVEVEQGGAVQPRPADQHHRQPAPEPDRQGHGDGVDGQVDPGGAVDLVPFGLRDVVGLVTGEPPGGVHEHQPERHRHVDQADEVRQQPDQPCRAHDRDLRVPPDDQGVGVVPGVAPPPGGRIAHDHEGGELVQALVQPAGLEGRAVPGLVPARVRRRAVQQAVGEEERHRPPAVPDRPEGDAEAGEQQDQADPDRSCPGRPGSRSASSAPSSACAVPRCGTSPRRPGRPAPPPGSPDP